MFTHFVVLNGDWKHGMEYFESVNEAMDFAREMSSQGNQAKVFKVVEHAHFDASKFPKIPKGVPADSKKAQESPPRKTPDIGAAVKAAVKTKK